MIVAASTAASAQRAPASGDVVETIPPDDASPPIAPAPPPSISAPPSSSPPSLTLTRGPHTIDLRGWARSSVLIGPDRSGPQSPPSRLDVPHDRVVASQQMFLRLRYAYARSFEAVASGLLAFDVFEQDAPRPDTFNLVNGAGTRTAFEPSLREAYVGAFWRRFDFRLGQQRIAWGRGDAFTPNDILDGRDLREQLIAERDAYHLPGFAARAGFDLGFGSIEAVVQPFFQPDRFDVYGSNWALIQADAPLKYITLLRYVDGAVAPQSPPADFTATSAAARFGVDVHRFDFNAYYQYGFDRTPSLEIDPKYAATLNAIDYAQPIDPALLAGPFLVGPRPIRMSYVRRHHVGADVATTVGPLLFRAEAAYDSSRVLVARDDLHGVIVPTLQATAGIEYQPGELGRVVLVEGWYQHAFDLDPAQALWFVERDSVAAAAVVKWHFFDERLLLEAHGVIGFQPFSWMARGEVGYKRKALQIRAGAAVLDGDPYSFGHYYRANTSVYLLFKYSI
jgi:hypothetical protein